MVRALLLAAVSTVATGLQLKDDLVPLDDDQMEESNLMSRTGGVAMLDPEGWGIKVTRQNPHPFHVTQPGEYLMIGIPKDFDYDTRPASEADLVMKATFEQSGIADHPCDDLMVKKITIEGTRIGPQFSKMEFGIAVDAYPGEPESYASIYMAVTWTGRRSAVQMFSDAISFREKYPGGSVRRTYEFPHIVQFCTFTPLPFLSQGSEGNRSLYTSDPYRRNRKALFDIECMIGESAGLSKKKQSMLKMQFSSVYYSPPGGKGSRATLENDMHVSLANVGSDPDGLLGTTDISVATNETANGRTGCNKKQPVDGPYQYIEQANPETRREKKKGPKHPHGPHHY